MAVVRCSVSVSITVPCARHNHAHTHCSPDDIPHVIALVDAIGGPLLLDLDGFTANPSTLRYIAVALSLFARFGRECRVAACVCCRSPLLHLSHLLHFLHLSQFVSFIVVCHPHHLYHRVCHPRALQPPTTCTSSNSAAASAANQSPSRP